MSKVVGIDVGGTFTDLMLVDEASGKVQVTKVPTTPENQAFGVINALEATKVPLSELASIVHGTTATTNALLERKISKVGLITTKGFRDVLELGRRTRPNAYGMTGTFRPLIPRDLRMEVDERIDADGGVVTPLDEKAVTEAAKVLMAKGCEALVIHFFNAYINTAHEDRAVEVAAKVWPNAYITSGTSVLPQFREYERGVTAAVNASIRPVLDRYIKRLREELASRGYTHDLLVMQGNGGTVSSSIVADLAAHTVLSGPASGVKAAAYTSSIAGFPNVVTYDMGGTSTDVALIRDGVPQVTAEFELEYAMPVHVPMVDIHTIGSGGGSLAYIDEAGILQVGPQSAGAKPGPICYGRGGQRPTITDANLVLGRLNAKKLLAVDSPVSVEGVAGIIEKEIGSKLGMSAVEAASAIVRIANDKMAGALRMVSLSRGQDPRDFALFAFGGAGPLHAVALARELAIPKVLVPVRPGITSALGCIVADVRHDYVRTVNKPVAVADVKQAGEILKAQREEGRRTIESENIPIEEIVYIHAADMQFQGQSHVLTVPLAGPEVTREGLQEAFEKVYFSRFEVRLPEIRAMLVNLRTAAIGKRKMVSLKALVDTAAHGKTLKDAHTETRKVWFDGGWHDTPVYFRDRLPAKAKFPGPAIIEQLDTTTIVEPDNTVEMDDYGNLIVTVPHRQGA
ncbi:MAG: hydantoinase/oxoprolinase family protein [Alphaproteobacteria bacterium]|nr:hydantoinase/oxoprolinase family protein [Alphaproteobacteria bacterium]